MPTNVRSHYIEDELAVRLPKHEILSTGTIPYLLELHADFTTVIKDKVDNYAKEVVKLQENSKFVNSLLDDINNLITDQKTTGIDLSKNPELQEKINKARELGVKIPENKTVFDENATERLINNITRKAKSWTEENQTLMQKVQELNQKLNMFLMMIKDAQKAENQVKRSSIAGIKN